MGLSAFHDVSYFHGKYYLYFGAAPAVLLLAPWKALTGTYLGENAAAAIFSWLGVLASVALVLVLRRRHFPSHAGCVCGLCLAALAFGNFAPLLLRRPVYYELAISSAYAFAMAALLFVALAQGDGRKRRIWLALAGLSYGLTLASRPNYLFGAVVLLVPFVPAWKAWRAGGAPDVRKLRGELIAVGTPLAAVAVLLLVYNALRFGSPLEFGTYYMISGLHPQHQAITSARYIPTNLWFYFLAPAQLSAYFPFFQVIHMPWFTLPAGYIGEEDAYGLCNTPFYLMALFIVASWRDLRLPALASMRAFVFGVLALVACNLFVLGRVGGAANRYMVDHFPALLPLACLGVFWLELSAGKGARRMLLRAAWIAALAYTAAFNVFVSLLHNDLLEHFNPSAYGRLAHAFNHLSSWLDETSAARTGPLRLRLRFPADKAGRLEPLVVTGLSFKADFIYLFYTDASHIQVGFEHTSYGGAPDEASGLDGLRRGAHGRDRDGFPLPPGGAPVFRRDGSRGGLPAEAHPQGRPRRPRDHLGQLRLLRFVARRRQRRQKPRLLRLREAIHRAGAWHVAGPRRQTAPETMRICVIGGGIVGLGTALQLQRQRPDSEILLLEKEPGFGRHQSTHNSGVLHAGLYYKPGSVKARMAVQGIRLMTEFCRSHGIAHEICGKLVVAVDAAEVPRLRGLLDRGRQNGLAGLEWLEGGAIREIEPNVAGVAAIRVPEEGIVDYGAVVLAMAGDARRDGVELHLDSRVEGLMRDGPGWRIRTGSGEHRADFIINCAGLHCDRVSALAGETRATRIVPFRGEYFKLRPESAHLVKNLIYPVPDPEFPFLGVHFTRLIHGGIEAGPNAILATSREGYRKADVSLADMWDALSFPGLWRFMGRHAGMCRDEVLRSFSKRRFCASLQRLVPAVTEADLSEGGSGVRAQAMTAQGELVQDFELIERPNALHVLNAPSPAATASLAIGEEIARRVLSAR